MAVTQAQVAQLYVALFNRAPEGAGFNAWVAAGANKTQAQLAQLMLESPAALAYYGNTIDTDKGYIETIYKNILGKDYSQDPNGIDSWVLHLQLGHSRGETLVKLFEVATSALAKAADPVAAKIFENKTALSAYMAEKIPNIQTDSLGNYDYAIFQEIIRTTTATNFDEQKAKIDALASATVHTLTNGAETLTGSAGVDIYSAVASSFADRNTLSVEDKIDGGAGNDMLNVKIDDSFTGFTTGYVKNVEALNLANTSNTQRVFNADKVEGLQSVSTHGTNGIRVTNLSNIVDLTVIDQKDSTEVGIAYNTELVKGKNDSQNLTLNNVGRATPDTENDSHKNSLKVKFNGIETLNITTREKASYIKDVENKFITVKGEADLTISTKDKDIHTKDFVNSLDASALTGNLTADLTESAYYTSIKSGNGNDTIKIGKLESNSVSIDMGAGNDTLQIEKVSSLKQIQLKGVDSIEIFDKNDSVSALDLTGQTDVKSLTAGQLDATLVITSSSIKTVNLTDKVDAKATSVGNGQGVLHINDKFVDTINYAIDNATTPQDIIGKVRVSESKNLTVNLDKSVKTVNGNLTDNAASVIEAPKATTINVNVNMVENSGLSLRNIHELKTINLTNNDPKKFTFDIHEDARVKTLNIATLGALDVLDKGLQYVSEINVKGLANMPVASLVELHNLGATDSENGVKLNVNDLVTVYQGSSHVTALKVGDVTTKKSTNAGANFNFKNVTNDIEVNKFDVGGEITFVANKIGNVKIADEIKSKNSGATFDISDSRFNVDIANNIDVKNDLNFTAKGVTGQVLISNIKAENVNINLSNIKGQNAPSAVNIGNMNADHVKNVNITLKDVFKDVVVGALDLKSAAVIDGKIKVKDSTSINIDAGNTKGIVNLGATGSVSADSVTVDLSKTIGANVFNSIVADTVVYKGSTQTPLSTDVNITMKQDINSKDFVANVTTSAQADKLVVTAATKFSLVNGSESVEGKDLETATISGDMGTGTDEYTFNDTNAEKLTKIDFSGLKNVEKGTITNTASKVIEIIKATDGDDTITLAGDQKAAKISIDAGEGNNTIKTGTFLAPGSAGADPKGQIITIKSGSGNDTFDVSTSVIGAGFDSANESHTRLVTIDKINVGDKIKFAGGTAPIEKVAIDANGNAQDNFALAAKHGGFFGGSHNQAGKIYAYSYLNDTYLVYNAATGDADFGAGDTIVKLSGVNIANLDTTVNAGEVTINAF
ncbi:flagellar hook-length control protein FliK [Campylobacter showae]|uniref:Flagellar hook-length control protein FliK n=1 Tax=Campylobacter showae CSUNSWCD TaxID=1244083 RepID=M5IHH5_9BACT|nr:flagellar hook-length control protein FliK [Campylobacter showae]EKU10270.1 Flagellar hook-length control protein FliK [Campylobacter showae CSUNSWCD]